MSLSSDTTRIPDASSVPPDTELMLEAREGNLEAFGELVRRHQKSLVNFFVRLGVYNDAEDLVQETLLRVYRSRERYEPRAKFTTYLYKVARNVWVDRYRKQGRTRILQERVREEQEVQGDAPGTSSRKLEVREALDELSEKLRMVVVMSVYQGLKYREIAEILDLPEGTVKSRMHLAVQRLKELLKTDGS